MKTLGLIGGTGPESTVDYYRQIIALYRERKGDGSYPAMIINSIDLHRFLDGMAKGEHARVAAHLAAEVAKLGAAGCDFAALTAITGHIVFDEVARQSCIPLISVIQATCEEAGRLGLKKLALFGSRYTMQARTFPEVFSKNGITIAVPHPDEQEWIHDHYMNELVKGIFLPETRAQLIAIMQRMKQKEGIEGVILGGTELPLILRDAPSPGIPYLDTTAIHVRALVEYMLTERGCKRRRVT